MAPRQSRPPRPPSTRPRASIFQPRGAHTECSPTRIAQRASPSGRPNTSPQPTMRLRASPNGSMIGTFETPSRPQLRKKEWNDEGDEPAPRRYPGSGPRSLALVLRERPRPLVHGDPGGWGHDERLEGLAVRGVAPRHTGRRYVRHPRTAAGGDGGR